MKTKLWIAILFGILCVPAICPSAMAHNLWLNPSNHYPQPGTTVDIGIGWGHQYPAGRVDQEITQDRMETISATGPDGRTLNLEKVSATLYRLPVEKAGVYLVTARIEPGFFTTTSEGRKWGNKQAIADPITCTNFHLEAKTVIIAGGEAKNLDRATGRPLELIPLTNLHDFKTGDTFTAKVLFEGKPLPNAIVRATYAGYQAGDSASHATSQKGHRADGKHYPVETVTDDHGLAVMQMDRPGFWMVLLSHKPPYADKQICDEYMHNLAFTFEIQPRP